MQEEDEQLDYIYTNSKNLGIDENGQHETPAKQSENDMLSAVQKEGLKIYEYFVQSEACFLILL